MCVCVCVGLFKWHLSFSMAKDERKSGWTSNVMQSRNPITKLTSFSYVVQVDLLPMHIAYTHSSHGAHNILKPTYWTYKHIWFDCKYIKYIDGHHWTGWRVCVSMRWFANLNDYFVTGLYFCSISHPSCVCRYCHLFPFCLFSFFHLSVRYTVYTSFGENDHITLYLNMIRVDYRLVCTAGSGWCFVCVCVFRLLAIYCCIPFSILSPKNTTASASILCF